MLTDDPALPAGGASIVFCWELGGGLGHVTKAVLLAERLLDRGCRVTFMLRDLDSIDGLLPQGDYRVLQAPVFRGVLSSWPDPADHAELLLHAGFGEAAGLNGRVRAWCDAFELLQADLVIADHAPTAVLAARCAGLPVALFGLGFSAPPPPWPVFRQWEAAPAVRLAQARRQVTELVNACLARHGRAPLAALPELLAGPANFLLTVPELDHYLRDADGAHRGCICIDDVGVPPAWPDGPGPCVFAYLRPQLTGLEDLLAALAASGARVLVRAAGIDEALRSRWTSPRLAFTAQFVRLADVAREAALVVCSGTDTAHGMALRGVPVLSLPMNAEQRVGAERLQATGAGLMALPGTGRVDLGTLLDRLLNRPEARAAARSLAKRHGPQDSQRVIDAVARDCIALLQRPGSVLRT